MSTRQEADRTETQTRTRRNPGPEAALAGPIVMKFGGTSVADPDAITRVIGIVKAARESSGLPPVVIVSAMSGVTDRLLELTKSAEQRRDAHVLNGVAE